jgi:hypothetical protein
VCARTRTGSAPRHDVAVVGYVGGSEASRNLAAAVCMSLPLEGLFQPIGNTPRNTSAASGPFVLVLQRSAATKKAARCNAVQCTAPALLPSESPSFVLSTDTACSSVHPTRRTAQHTPGRGRGSGVESGRSPPATQRRFAQAAQQPSAGMNRIACTAFYVQHAIRCSMQHAACGAACSMRPAALTQQQARLQRAH